MCSHFDEKKNLMKDCVETRTKQNQSMSTGVELHFVKLDLINTQMLFNSQKIAKAQLKSFVMRSRRLDFYYFSKYSKYVYLNIVKYHRNDHNDHSTFCDAMSLICVCVHLFTQDQIVFGACVQAMMMRGLNVLYLLCLCKVSYTAPSLHSGSPVVSESLLQSSFVSYYFSGCGSKARAGF